MSSGMQPPASAGLPAKARESLAGVLEYVLTEEGILLATTRDCRWQVTGPHLYSLHRLFEEQRRQLDYWLKRVIERTKSIGLRGRTTLEKAPAIEGTPSGHRGPPRAIIGELLTRHEEMAERLRRDIVRLPDPATADLLSHLMEFHETTAWMLRMVVTQSSTPDELR